MIKTICIGFLFGVTLGVSLAGEVFNRIGMQPQTYMMVMAGLVVAALIINRGVGMVAAIVAMTIAVLQPEQVLVDYGFDKDILMAALLAMLIYPVVYRVMQS